MRSPMGKHLFCKFLVILVFSTIGNTSEVGQSIPTNHKENGVSTSAPTLDMEPRGDSDGLDLNTIEEKSKESGSTSSINDKSDKQPIILGTSKVAIVYSERKPTLSDKEKNVKVGRFL